MKKAWLGVVIGVVTYSIVVFAYIHDRFVGKDIFEMICERLDRIEFKLDKLIAGE